MTLIWYPKCSTCQKAKKWLDTKNAEYKLRDIKLEALDKEELAELYRKSGKPLRKFFNTSGLVYKSMGLKDKLAQMSDEQQIALLSSDGMLVKRPILVTVKGVAVGFKEEEWASLID